MLQAAPFYARRAVVRGREWDLTSRPDLKQLAHELGTDLWHIPPLDTYTTTELRELVWQLILRGGVR